MRKAPFFSTIPSNYVAFTSASSFFPSFTFTKQRLHDPPRRRSSLFLAISPMRQARCCSRPNRQTDVSQPLKSFLRERVAVCLVASTTEDEELGWFRRCLAEWTTVFSR